MVIAVVFFTILSSLLSTVSWLVYVKPKIMFSVPLGTNSQWDPEGPYASLGCSLPFYITGGRIQPVISQRVPPALIFCFPSGHQPKHDLVAVVLT